MHYREFGNTGQGFRNRTWYMAVRRDWGSISETGAGSILSEALEQGINFFDTADCYGAGRSESIIGGFLSDRKMCLSPANWSS